MPIRHGDMFASRASTWPRDHFCRSTMAPRRSRPIAWNEFLPISMPIVAMVAIDLLDMAVLRLTLAPSQHHSPVGQEHGRTIPLPDSRRLEFTERGIRIRTCQSLRLDAGEPDHLAPFFCFIGDELAELGGRSRQRHVSQVSKTAVQLGIDKPGVDR